MHHKKEKFKPIKRGSVRLYTCGPTVHDFVHIGNLRTFIFEDLLRRVLKFNGYKVKQVMNITDIEDKIIKRLHRGKKSLKELTETYTQAFFEDIKKLNIQKAEFYPRATREVATMIRLIERLMRKGFAYQGKDKSIYFDISKFKRYGKLSGLKKRELKIGARIAADEYTKKEARDFVLWKAKRSGEPWWKSPWGPGRPGWHIECSAMSMKYLGANVERSRTIDIHTGAVDLIFPHHENEIAQSEAATHKKFVNYWLEAEHLLVNKKKMSKSLHNFYTLRDLEKKGFYPLSFRYLVLQTHYRSKLNFTWQALKSVEKTLIHLYRVINSLPKDKRVGEEKRLAIYKEKFLRALEDDLNTPKALALLHAVLKDSSLAGRAKEELVAEFDKVFGLKLLRPPIERVLIPLKVKKLVETREKLRANQQFIKADILRKKVKGLGYKIEDTKEGPVVRAL